LRYDGPSDAGKTDESSNPGEIPTIEVLGIHRDIVCQQRCDSTDRCGRCVPVSIPLASASLANSCGADLSTKWTTKIRNRNHSQWVGREERFERERGGNPGTSHCMIGSFIRIGAPPADRRLSLSVRG